MTRRKKIYEGKAKILYEGPEPGTLIQYFKDDATAFDGTEEGGPGGQGRHQQSHQRVRDDAAERASACRTTSSAA